jgi:hypothetical protein
MRSQKPSYESRAGERGAALITAVLLSLLLLAAGGTLILTATMTSVTARDSTAEMQAYYAAEAGVARSLEVLRGNVQSNPAGTRASFRNIVCNRGLWTNISGALVNVTNDGSARFQVTSIIDPDNQDSATMCDPVSTPNYKPDRLRIRVTGMGPGNSEKKMEIVVARYTLDYEVNSVLTAQNESANPFAIALGDSNVTTMSGVDKDAPSSTPLPAIAVSTSDYNITNNVADGCNADGSNCGNGPNVTPDDPMVLVAANTPSFLQSVEKTRLFLYGPEGMMNAAINQGRYFTTGAAAISSTAGLGASNPDGVLTFVDGDLVLGPGTPTGQGTLIVTGNLTLDGSATIQYSSSAVDMARAVGGHAVKGVHEY